MKVVTVTGNVDPADIGVTMTHEHIRYLTHDNLQDKFCDDYLAKPKNAKEEEISNLKVTLENLNEISKNEFLVKDNIAELSPITFDEAIEAAMIYKNHGGNTLTDITNDSIGRNPNALVRLSNQTGVKIVAGTGYYVGISHPEYIKKWSVERVKEEIVKDLTVGIWDTDIRAGIIGEIGALDAKLTSEEAKTIEAAALAQVETGAGIFSHCRGIGRLDAHKPQIEIFERVGANPEKIVIAHRDGMLSHLKRDQYLTHFQEILDKGYYIAFDTFGMEKQFKHGLDNYQETVDWDTDVKYDPNSKIRFDWAPVFNVCKDIERVEAVMDIINMGYTNKILLSHDISQKMHYKKYGGYGWSHILETVVPLLLAAGATQSQVDTILKKNPARLLERNI